MTWSPSDSDNPKPAYGGKAVRIKCYWTKALFWDDNQKHAVGTATFKRISVAAKILTKYTLSLDWPNQVEILEFYDRINPGGGIGGEPFQKLRDLIDRARPPAENRLIVVFTPLVDEWGFTVTHGMWLPWVLVDPRTTSYEPTLMHEIGHACRLGHFDGTIMREANDKYDNFLNFQVHEIYRSYWCEGDRPKEWWIQKGNPHEQAFLWEPRGTPTP